MAEGDKNMTAAPTLKVKRNALLVAIAAALMLPQLALGDEARERALEARVAELEKIVNQLVEQSKAQAAAPAPMTTRRSS
jgi:hypothetical protein